MKDILTRIKSNNLLRNIGANVIFQVLSMILSFMYVPISRAYLGDYRYGVWATISSVVSWLTLSDIGIGYGLRNRLTEALARDNKGEAKKLLSTAYFVMFFICLAILIIYLILSKSFNIAKAMNIAIDGDDTNLALDITMLFMCINFWLGLVSQIFYAVQKAAINTFAGVLNQVLNIALIIVATKYIPVNLPSFSIMLGTATLIVRIVSSIYAYKKYSYLLPNIFSIQKEYIHSIASIGLALFVGQMCSIIMNSTDNLLISKFFSAADVTPYTTAYKLFSLFITLQGVMIMPMWSAFTLHKENKDYAWMKHALKRMNQLTSLLSFGVIILVFFVPLLSDLWLKHHLNYDFLMLLLMAVYTILYMFACNYGSLLAGVGDIRLYTIASAVSAIVNIPVSIFLAVECKMGLSGIIGGTVVSTLIIAIAFPLEVKKYFKTIACNLENEDKVV